MNALLPARAPRPSLPLFGALALALGRVHECCGPARHTWAMIVAGALSGPVLWIAPRWLRDRPHPDGIRPFAGPERFLFAAPEHRMELLWCMEEALRSAAGMVARSPVTTSIAKPLRAALSRASAAYPG